MPLFGQRQTLRRLAAQMLLVWLFALASTMVNACMLVPAQPLAGSTVRHLPCHGEAGEAEAPALPAVGACVKFCVDKSGSAPLNEQGLDLQATQWLALPPAGMPDLHAAPERSSARADAQRPPPGARVPIPIAFLRLTR